jgi:hypothetical protein
MKIYGVGVLTAPGSSRVIHDFVDGPFDTVNPVLIQEAKRRGYSFSPPSPELANNGIVNAPTIAIVGDDAPETIVPKDTPKMRGRPKGVKNVNA